MEEDVVVFFERKLKEFSDPIRAQKMTEYLKDKQPHLGVYTPARQFIYKEFKRRNGKNFKEISQEDLFEIVDKLWNKPEREYRYVSLFLIDYVGKLSINDLDFVKKLIIEGDWWDTTDSIAIDFVSKILLKENKDEMTPIIKKWVHDDNLWIKRTAILSQLYFKEDTDTELFEYCIVNTMKEDEFFIQKAIGWALREYSKTDPGYVAKFIENYRDQLSKLSIREGEKHLKKTQNN